MPDLSPLQSVRREAFGRRVRELRQARSLSQEGFAHIAGLDRTYVGGVERGERNISLDNIHRLADALAVEPWELFSTSAPVTPR